jgi:hypothetical protein
MVFQGKKIDEEREGKMKWERMSEERERERERERWKGKKRKKVKKIMDILVYSFELLGI